MSIDGRRERRRQARIAVVRGRPRADLNATSSVLANSVFGDWLTTKRDSMTGRLLDLGAGNQPYLGWYQDVADDVVAFDAIPGDDTDVVGTATALPFADGVFDTVLCASVLEHVENVENAVAEVARVLKPGGLFLVSVPFVYPTHEAPYDFWRTTHHGLRSLLERHDMTVRDVGAQGGPVLLLLHFAFGALSQALGVVGRRLGQFGKLVDNRLTRGCLVLPQILLRRAFGHHLSAGSRLVSLGYMAEATRD